MCSLYINRFFICYKTWLAFYVDCGSPLLKLSGFWLFSGKIEQYIHSFISVIRCLSDGHFDWQWSILIENLCSQENMLIYHWRTLIKLPRAHFLCVCVTYLIRLEIGINYTHVFLPLDSSGISSYSLFILFMLSPCIIFQFCLTSCFIPLFMQLREDHHLKYGGRMQLGLFLKVVFCCHLGIIKILEFRWS